jgi:hypothetical protein
MTGSQFLFCGLLVAIALWSLAMQLFRPEEWARQQERDAKWKKEAFGGLTKVALFALQAYVGKRK